MTEDRTFTALGTTIRLVARGPRAAARARRAEAFIRRYDARLSRFRDDSELCALNADPRAVVPASPLLRDAVAAALWAAQAGGGLVDPTLLGELERAGYAASLAPGAGGPPPAAPAAPGDRPPRPARPHPAERWRAVRVDDQTAAIARPPGVRLDLGGSGKGRAADLAAALLAGAPRWAVDCGGDVRVGGTAGERQVVEVAHPLDPGLPAARFTLTAGAAATSAITARAWRRADGRRAHHLLDPATGEPAWTGVVAATALAPTVLEAETLAKTALLSGPSRGGRVLARHGGLLVDGEGSVRAVGPLAGALDGSRVAA